MPVALLPDRAIVTVTGEEAENFLQGVVTCNVATLPEGEARLGALLTPQGKWLADFFLGFVRRSAFVQEARNNIASRNAAVKQLDV